jgi:hypothetical protein
MTPQLYLEKLIRFGNVDASVCIDSNHTWGLAHVVARLAESLKKENFGLF